MVSLHNITVHQDHFTGMVFVVKDDYFKRPTQYPVLRNRNYFYGSGSDFLKDTVPVPTFGHGSGSGSVSRP